MQKKEDDVATKRITIERFSITSTKPFADVVSAIATQVGHPDIGQFYSGIQTAEDDLEVQRLVDSAIGPTDLMEFMRLDRLVDSGGDVEKFGESQRGALEEVLRSPRSGFKVSP